MTKYNDEVTVVDGIKTVLLAPRKIKKSQKTFQISRSRYTLWHQGATKCLRNHSVVSASVTTFK